MHNGTVTYWHIVVTCLQNVHHLYAASSYLFAIVCYISFECPLPVYKWRIPNPSVEALEIIFGLTKGRNTFFGTTKKLSRLSFVCHWLHTDAEHRMSYRLYCWYTKCQLPVCWGAGNSWAPVSGCHSAPGVCPPPSSEHGTSDCVLVTYMGISSSKWQSCLNVQSSSGFC